MSLSHKGRGKRVCGDDPAFRPIQLSKSQRSAARIFPKGAGYAFIPCPFAKKGDGAPIGATFSQCTHLAMRGAFRRAIAAFFFRRRAALFVKAFGASSVSQLLAGALAPGGAPAPPQPVFTRHGQGRRIPSRHQDVSR